MYQMIMKLNQLDKLESITPTREVCLQNVSTHDNHDMFSNKGVVGIDDDVDPDKQESVEGEGQIYQLIETSNVHIDPAVIPLTQCRGLCGMTLTCRREATKGGIDCKQRKPDSLSKETTKQHQTTSTSSEPSEPATTPVQGLDGW